MIRPAASRPAARGPAAPGPTLRPAAVLASLARDRRGVAAVEFALLAPVMVLVVFGTICLGLAMTYQHEVEELASSAARASVAGLSTSERATLAQQFVANAVAQSPLLVAGDVQLTTSQSGSPASQYRVSITYSLQDTPVPGLATIIGASIGSIAASSTVEFGGY